MKILFCTMEAYPFAKVGGLADVAGALPKALHELGHDIRLILPHYGAIDEKSFDITLLDDLPAMSISMGEVTHATRIHRSIVPETEIPVYLVSCDELYGRPGIYGDPGTGEGYPDNDSRMLFFCRAILEFVNRYDWAPNIFHCNDAHTAFVTEYLSPRWGYLSGNAPAGSLLTIHNIGGPYQGIFDKSILEIAGIGEEHFHPGSIYEFWGKVNFMKVGIYSTDVISTVSEKYAEEISTLNEYGNGLEGILHHRKADLHGILNGIDESVWNPETDGLIFRNFNRGSIELKEENKKGLMEQAGFPATRDRIPLVGMISRLVDQKGFDLLKAEFHRILDMRLRLIILGTGQANYEEFFLEMSHKHPDRFHYCNEFNNPLAHRIEAGSDMFLMPSRYEPCGLNQMYSLRYGTIPVVRDTGGLSDTIRDVSRSSKNGNGFKFRSYSGKAMVRCLERACEYYGNERKWRDLQRTGMGEDFSWKRSAGKYVELYEKALGKAKCKANA